MDTKDTKLCEIIKYIFEKYVNSKLQYFRHLHTAAPAPTVSGKGQTEAPRRGSAL